MSNYGKSELEVAKRAAAVEAVNELVKDKQVIGIGSGTTIVYAVERLAQRVSDEKLSVICVPSSFQATQLIIQHHLPLGDLWQYPDLDLAIDGADEVDQSLSAIKGGGGCLLQEKLVAANAKLFAIIADYSKQAQILGQTYEKVAIEVIPAAYVTVQRQIERLFNTTPATIVAPSTFNSSSSPVAIATSSTPIPGKNNSCVVSATLRMGTSTIKAGPILTDSGHFILDVRMGVISDPVTAHNKLKAIVGVVETGLFPNMASIAYFGQRNGSVCKVYPTRS